MHLIGSSILEQQLIRVKGLPLTKIVQKNGFVVARILKIEELNW